MACTTLRIDHYKV